MQFKIINKNLFNEGWVCSREGLQIPDQICWGGHICIGEGVINASEYRIAGTFEHRLDGINITVKLCEPVIKTIKKYFFFL